jgi:hypothetical protein
VGKIFVRFQKRTPTFQYLFESTGKFDLCRSLLSTAFLNYEKLLLIAWLGLLSCNKKDSVGPELLTACGVTNPAENLPWLKEMIVKAEEDRLTKAHKGNYTGSIYQITWRGQDVFWTNFAMGSGGIGVRAFNCDGQWISKDFTPDETEEFIKVYNNNKLIYTNLPR